MDILKNFGRWLLTLDWVVLKWAFWGLSAFLSANFFFHLAGGDYTSYVCLAFATFGILVDYFKLKLWTAGGVRAQLVCYAVVAFSTLATVFGFKIGYDQMAEAHRMQTAVYAEAAAEVERLTTEVEPLKASTLVDSGSQYKDNRERGIESQAVLSVKSEELARAKAALASVGREESRETMPVGDLFALISSVFGVSFATAQVLFYVALAVFLELPIMEAARRTGKKQVAVYDEPVVQVKHKKSKRQAPKPKSVAKPQQEAANHAAMAVVLSASTDDAVEGAIRRAHAQGHFEGPGGWYDKAKAIPGVPNNNDRLKPIRAKLFAEGVF